MTRAIRHAILRYVLAVCGLCVSFGMVLMYLLLSATGSLAHGDAWWIMENPRYVDADGRHCCGPADCKRERAVFFRESPEGIWVTHIDVEGGPHESLMRRGLVGQGLYPSVDDDWWICARNGRVHCVFKPTTGT